MKYKTDQDQPPVNLASEPAAPAYGSEREYAWEGDRVAMAALVPEDTQRIEREWDEISVKPIKTLSRKPYFRTRR